MKLWSTILGLAFLCEALFIVLVKSIVVQRYSNKGVEIPESILPFVSVHWTFIISMGIAMAIALYIKDEIFKKKTTSIINVLAVVLLILIPVVYSASVSLMHLPM